MTRADADQLPTAADVSAADGTLEWLGGASPLDFPTRSDTGLDEVVRTSAAAKEWWTSLESLILVLTLAGYECPEIAIVKVDEPSAYLRLFAWEDLDYGEGLIVLDDAEWATASGVTAAQSGATAWAATLLRVTVRRTLDTQARRAHRTPPLFTPLPLAGPLPEITAAATAAWPRYARHSDPADPFTDPSDGWVVFPHAGGLTTEMAIPKFAGRRGRRPP